MSLINDYLKKTEHNTKGNFQAGDLPPVLKTIGKSSGPSVYLRIVSVALLVLILGAAIYLYGIPGKIRNDYGIKNQVTETADKIEVSRPEAGKTDKPLNLNKPEPASEKKSKLVSIPIEEIKRPAIKQETENAPAVLSGEIKDSASGVRVSSVRQQAPADAPVIDVNNYYQVGFIAQKDGRYDEAVKYYQQVLAYEPGHLDALTNLTVISIEKRRYEQARKYIARIRKLDPSNTKTYVNEGLIYLKAGNMAAAVKSFEAALNIDVGEESALINLAYIASRQNDTELMERCYKMTAVPADEIALTYASMLEKQSRYDDAVTVYAGVLNKPENQRNYKLINSIKDRIRLISAY